MNELISYKYKNILIKIKCNNIHTICQNLLKYFVQRCQKCPENLNQSNNCLQFDGRVTTIGKFSTFLNLKTEENQNLLQTKRGMY